MTMHIGLDEPMHWFAMVLLESFNSDFFERLKRFSLAFICYWKCALGDKCAKLCCVAKLWIKLKILSN